MTAKAATKEQKRRFEGMKALGCIACILDNRTWAYPDIHHMTRNNKRLGHWETVPLCAEHHVSNTKISWHMKRATFRKRYGTDAELIATTNEFLKAKGLWNDTDR